MPERAFNNNSGGGGKFPKWGSFIAIIVMALIFVGSPKKFLHTFKSVEDEKVVDYLHVGREFTLFSYEEIYPNLHRLHHISDEFINDLRSVHNSFREDIVELTPPEHFKEYHDVLIEFVVRQDTILREANQVKLGKVDAFNILVERNNETNEQLTKELKQALEDSNIPYKQLENGLIEYEVQVANPATQYKYMREQDKFYERWDRLQHDF